jgi:sugar phosphate isomerase/epimerase
MQTRRDFGRIALAGISSVALARTRINSVIKGVDIGAQTYSFRNLPLDAMIQAMAEVGLGDCEVYSPHIEPKTDRAALRQWRLTVPLSEIKAARQKFEDAGINVSALNLSFKDDFTDPEIDRGFEIAKAFGVNVITASSTLSVAPRVAPYAEKHQMTVAFHGHDNTADPNEFAKPETFDKAMAMSKRFLVNLDIGHFTAAGYDPIEYIQAHHDKIVILHLKDRNKNDRKANLPWGQGQTPIKEVLQLLRDKKWPIKAFIEYEYAGKDDAVTEVKRCFEYCKNALA